MCETWTCDPLSLGKRPWGWGRPQGLPHPQGLLPCLAQRPLLPQSTSPLSPADPPTDLGPRQGPAPAPGGELAPGAGGGPKASPSPLLLLHDADIRRALVDFQGHVYHYKQNALGRGFVLGVCAVLCLGAIGIGVATGLSSVWWVLAVAGLVGAALCGLFYVAHWQKFALSHFIALGQSYLYTGSNRRAWRVSWELLDTHSSGLTRLDTTTARSILPMRVAGQSIPVHLYHPLAHIDDLQGFMFELLRRMPQPGGGDGEEE